VENQGRTGTISDIYEQDAWQPWIEAAENELAETGLTLDTDVKLINAVVAAKAAEYEQNQKAADWQNSQQLAELVALEAERAVEAKYGEETWKQIKNDVWDSWTESDPTDDVLQSAQKCAERLDYHAWHVLEKKRKEWDAEEWSRVRDARADTWSSRSDW
jgi:hypothetical protein